MGYHFSLSDPLFPNLFRDIFQYLRPFAVENLVDPF